MPFFFLSLCHGAVGGWVNCSEGAKVETNSTCQMCCHHVCNDAVAVKLNRGGMKCHFLPCFGLLFWASSRINCFSLWSSEREKTWKSLFFWWLISLATVIIPCCRPALCHPIVWPNLVEQRQKIVLLEEPSGRLLTTQMVVLLFFISPYSFVILWWQTKKLTITKTCNWVEVMINSKADINCQAILKWCVVLESQQLPPAAIGG